MSTSLYFYSNLPVYYNTLTQLLSRPFHFSKVPEDWYAVVVDIERSTQAVKHDMLASIKLTAAMCVAAVESDIHTADALLQIPHFFGGDGITFLVPKSYKIRTELILENIRAQVHETYFLRLRVGAIQLATLYKHDNNTQLKISKLKLTPKIVLPVVYGDALIKAESYIKSKVKFEEIAPRQEMYVDYNSSKSRQLQVLSKTSDKNIFCFIIYPKSSSDDLTVLHHISSKMDAVFGDYETRFPISIEDLKHTEALFNEHEDMLLASEKGKIKKILMSLSCASTYLGKHSKLIENALNTVTQSSLAFLMDGGISDVIRAKDHQIKAFVSYLESLERDDKIIFGYHTAKTVVINASALLKQDGWRYFMDGFDGGFSKAAKMLKLKSKVIGAD